MSGKTYLPTRMLLGVLVLLMRTGLLSRGIGKRCARILDISIGYET